MITIALAGALVAACGVSPTQPSGGGAPGAGGSGVGGSGGNVPVDTSPPEWNKPVTAPTDADAAAKRASCGYAKGALPAETQGASAPMGKDIPLDTIVVMMMENRSFDHYFQGAAKAGLKDVEVAPDGSQNLDPDGLSVPIFRDNTLCFVDTAHGWDAVHQQINGGKMDGFVTSNDATHEMAIPGIPLSMMTGNRAMGHYEEADVPFMYWAAKTFAIGDHYHASVPGPTWPNRMYLYAASSFGRAHNAFPENVEATLFDHLDVRGVPFRIYRSETPCYAIFPDRMIKILNTKKVADFEQFYADAAAGTLPPVVFIDAGFSIDDKESYMQEDEHPPAILEYGQRVMARVAQAMIKSPQWKRSAMFVTYDEHGGLYDHVVPPPACPPDAFPPDKGAPGEGFDMLGVPTRPEAPQLDSDAGRQGVTHRPVDRGSFKAPSIRDAARTGPYMHHGRFATLEQVVDFYDRGGGRGIGLAVPDQDPDVRPLHLTPDDRRALLVFLREGVLGRALSPGARRGDVGARGWQRSSPDIG